MSVVAALKYVGFGNVREIEFKTKGLRTRSGQEMGTDKRSSRFKWGIKDEMEGYCLQLRGKAILVQT